MATSLPQDIDQTLLLLNKGNYIAERNLATTLFLALKMGRPLFLEGEAGVGKTEIAKVLSDTLGRRLLRLQCYEGLDVSSAVYEWNYARATGPGAGRQPHAPRAEESCEEHPRDGQPARRDGHGDGWLAEGRRGDGGVRR